MSRNFMTLVLIGAVLILGYVMYRFVNVPNQSLIESAEFPKNMTGYPPFRCELYSGDFDGGVNGTFYMKGGQLRATYYYEDGYGQKPIEIIVPLVGDVYAWEQGSDEGITTKEFLTVTADAPSHTDAKCHPWWMPDASYFEIPNSITFTRLK